MPRLTGYRERIHRDFYDGRRVDSMPSSACSRFFGGDQSRVGEPFCTNMTINGQLVAEQTFVILAMRARTNLTRLPMTNGTKEVVRDAFLVGDDDAAIRMIMDSGSWERSDLTKAFDEWLHATTATLVIGERPIFDTNLYDLITESQTPISLYDGVIVSEEPDPISRFVAHRGSRSFATPVILPVRQGIYVDLISSGETATTLATYAKKADVAPYPMVWIHLEGLLTRDVG